MARGPFTPRHDGSVHARLGVREAQVVRRVAQDLIEAMAVPEEPSMYRLFPPAYLGDDPRQRDFADMTRDDLIEGKKAAAEVVVASIDEGSNRRSHWTAVLDQEAAGCWLRVLNDARLVLGTRLGIDEEEQHRLLPAEDPRATAMNLYLYLSGLEELLVDAMIASQPGVPPQEPSS